MRFALVAVGAVLFVAMLAMRRVMLFGELEKIPPPVSLGISSFPTFPGTPSFTSTIRTWIGSPRVA